MVTSNMESRNPMGRVYAENRLKTQKLLGVKGLRLHIFHTILTIQAGPKAWFILLDKIDIKPLQYRDLR